MVCKEDVNTIDKRKMKQRLLFYTVWIAIFLCISILIIFITAITQGYFLYLNLLIYVPMIILSSASFAVIFEDKWWVSLIEGMVTSLPALYLFSFYLNTFNSRKSERTFFLLLFITLYFTNFFV